MSWIGVTWPNPSQNAFLWQTVPKAWILGFNFFSCRRNWLNSRALLKPLQNKKGQKNLRYRPKKQSFSEEKDCFFSRTPTFFVPSYSKMALAILINMRSSVCTHPLGNRSLNKNVSYYVTNISIDCCTFEMKHSNMPSICHFMCDN